MAVFRRNVKQLSLVVSALCKQDCASHFMPLINSERTMVVGLAKGKSPSTSTSDEMIEKWTTGMPSFECRMPSYCE